MSLQHATTGAELIGDDGKTITFEIAGSDSVAFRNASRQVSNARINRPKGEKFTAEQADADGLAILCACVMGWSGNFSIGGVKPVWSHDEARRLLDSQPCIKEQIDRFIGLRANFLPRA
jgi:hypothetical protein